MHGSHCAKKRIEECNEKLNALAQYREADDQYVQQLITEKQQQEQELLNLQEKLTDARIRLGKAKSGIVSQSLEEAEAQIRSALNIQQVIYDESRVLNEKKYRDEKEHLEHLSKCYQDLYDHYEKRYQKVNRHLSVLDVDGITGGYNFQHAWTSGFIAAKNIASMAGDLSA